MFMNFYSLTSVSRRHLSFLKSKLFHAWMLPFLQGYNLSISKFCRKNRNWRHKCMRFWFHLGSCLHYHLLTLFWGQLFSAVTSIYIQSKRTSPMILEQNLRTRFCNSLAIKYMVFYTVWKRVMRVDHVIEPLVLLAMPFAVLESFKSRIWGIFCMFCWDPWFRVLDSRIMYSIQRTERSI